MLLYTNISWSNLEQQPQSVIKSIHMELIFIYSIQETAFALLSPIAQNFYNKVQMQDANIILLLSPISLFEDDRYKVKFYAWIKLDLD